MENQATIKYPSTSDKKKGQAQKIDQLIGERLKEIRKLKKLTQEDVAEKLGVSFQQIQKYENGKNRISFSRLYELSNFMNVPLESFVSNIHESASPEGFSSKPQSRIPPAHNDSVSEKETEELLSIYYSLEDPELRKNLLQFIRSMAENLKE